MDRKQVIIFAGTTEGRTISEYLASCKVPVTACVATEYGETLLTENEYLKVHAGRMDQEEIAAFIREKGAELVIDATHPYAAVVSENVAAACERESGGLCAPDPGQQRRIGGSGGTGRFCG